MVIGAGLRAIKPLRRQKFRFAVLLPTLEVFKLKSGLTNNKDWDKAADKSAALCNPDKSLLIFNPCSYYYKSLLILNPCILLVLI